MLINHKIIEIKNGTIYTLTSIDKLDLYFVFLIHEGIKGSHV